MSSENKDIKLNIDYLCKGVYHDNLSNISNKSEDQMINNYKKKMMNNSNGLNNIFTDTKYKKIVLETKSNSSLL